MNGTVGHNAKGLAAVAAHEVQQTHASKNWRAAGAKEKCVIAPMAP
jgi:hypothetical protein